MPPTVAEQLNEILRVRPGLDKGELVVELLSRGVLIGPRAVNSALYSNRDTFEHRKELAFRPRWYVINKPLEPPPQPTVRSLEELAADLRTLMQPDFIVDLYPWQRRALNDWQHAGSCGVVEAVTGGGKTRLALAAARLELQSGGKVLVIAPSTGLVDQWETEIRKHLGAHFPSLRVGRLGNGRRESLRTCDVLVATVQSAADNPCGLGTLSGGLLIADECHRCGAPKWSNSLKPHFPRRLGLTATYQREDDGVEDFLDPYFGGVVHSLTYRTALDEDVIAHFKVTFIGVRFDADEQAAYDVASEKALKYRRRLVNEYGVPDQPFGKFLSRVSYLKNVGMGEESRLAGLYLNAFIKKRNLLSTARAKMVRLADLAPAIRAADRTIVFAETRAAAHTAVDVLSVHGVEGEVLDSTMDLDDRRKVFAAFEDGDHELLAAPRLLDEGIDVPAADLAIILATSRSRRQMIQRMGRVVRKKDDGRLARVAILYVAGTTEDPTEGAHEDFVEQIENAADNVTVFPPDMPARRLIAYLNSWSTAGSRWPRPVLRRAG